MTMTATMMTAAIMDIVMDLIMEKAKPAAQINVYFLTKTYF